MRPTQSSEIQQLLEEKFHLTTFRPGQLEIIQSLLAESHLLCIQPTGYGKSLLYQLPSCILGGLTIVISPLLALMRDQIDQLKSRFQIPAATINSDQTPEENALVRTQLLRGELQILFVSPEMLDHIDHFEFLLQLSGSIPLLVIDEAHCISTWGHDFRPSYRHILQFSQALKKIRPELKILALTATADLRTEQDIVGQLSMNQEKVRVWREKMDRPNIHLSVIGALGIATKLTQCLLLLQKLEGHGLIYCATRDHVELVAEYLAEQGQSAIGYHAGLESEKKREIQTAFSQNKYRIVAATSALGMGIDKKDLRFIIHFDIPGSITAYYQEVGRCGRDGLKAEGILLYDRADRKVQDYFIDSSLPKEEDFIQVLDTVRTSVDPPNMTAIKRITGFHPTRVTIVLAELLDQQFLQKKSVKGVQCYYPMEPEPKRSINLSRYTTQHKVKTEELHKILSYAEQLARCRMALLRESLGDTAPPSCGKCDVCQKSPREIRLDPKATFQWLLTRKIPIAGSKTGKISEGLSLLDNQLHTALFVRFMRSRATSDEIDPEILELLFKQVVSLKGIGAVVPLPSRTWKAGLKYAAALAEFFHVPLLQDLLAWDSVPKNRQGELLNNDQRQENVRDKMEARAHVASKSLVLFDDYIGSGATMKEAARALRQVFQGEIIPVTIARVQWRLGKPGFI